MIAKPEAKPKKKRRMISHTYAKPSDLKGGSNSGNGDTNSDSSSDSGDGKKKPASSTANKKKPSNGGKDGG